MNEASGFHQQGKPASRLGRPAFDRLRARALGRPLAEINTGWEDVLVPLGLTLAGEAFTDEEMIARARQWVDHHLEAGFPEGYPNESGHRNQHSGERHKGFFLTPYCGEWGGAMVLALLAAKQGGEAYRAPAIRVAEHIISGSLRWDDGVIVHGNWSELPWVDTLYYSSSPLARVFALSGDERYAEEAVNQCLLHARHLRDETTGCFVHEAHKDGKRTSWHWARGNGWVIKAFADTLRLCPKSTKGWSEALAIYRSLCVGLMRTQHGCGLWRIVPENEESHLETSGSVMIATGLAVGIAEDWIDEGVTSGVMRVLNEVETWIDADGRLLGCQTPAGLGGWERHKLSLMGERTYGDGALLRLLAECRAINLI